MLANFDGPLTTQTTPNDALMLTRFPGHARLLRDLKVPESAPKSPAGTWASGGGDFGQLALKMGFGGADAPRAGRAAVATHSEVHA